MICNRSVKPANSGDRSRKKKKKKKKKMMILLLQPGYGGMHIPAASAVVVGVTAVQALYGCLFP